MPQTTPCPRCHHANDTGSRFCAECGASLAPEVHCPSCNALNPLSNRFCIQCGATLANAGWAGRDGAQGAVMDGVWERAPGEFVRRVDPEDARKFLGNRSVRVPPGTVGVVVLDGSVDRVLPPGERTTLNLFERLGDFFLRREGRSAFYLIDQRPIPIPFVVQSRAVGSEAGAKVVKTQVLVSFTLPKGDKAALGAFLTNVLGDKPGFGASELHALLRPDVVRVSQEVLERLASESTRTGDLPFAEAEARIRQRLQDYVGPRHGLTLDVSIAPLTTVASFSFHVGRHGTSYPPLFTQDAHELELDLVVRVQGQHESFAPASIEDALAGAAAAFLRATTWADFRTATGFAGLEDALQGPAVAALDSHGLTLLALSVVDVRSKTGQWLLQARSQLDREHEDLQISDERLDMRETREAQADRAATLDRQALDRAAGLDGARHGVRRRTELEESEHQSALQKKQLEREADRLALQQSIKDQEELRQIEKLRAMAAIDRELADDEHRQALEKRRQLEGLDADRMIAIQAAELAASKGGDAWAHALAARAAAESEQRHAKELADTYKGAMDALAKVATSRAEAAPAPAIAVTTEAVVTCKACRAPMRAGAKFCGACGAGQE